ncbi:MAG: carboxypeptidase-like regulatory domain-containing protein [Chitinophagaceae bacterium]|nr:carboxypeptidase-like regulatory domain-containing protein [Chitinophagaceae bacterium]
MAKKLQLTIAEPCHENWDGMTPVEKGKFCGSCQKQVIDFSNMSDRQVAEFFKKPSTGSVCGRFMTDQLDRPIEIPRKRIPWVKYFFQIAIPAFLVSIKASAQKTQGQINVKSASKDTIKRGGVFADERITLGMVARPENLKPFMVDTVVTPIIDTNRVVKGEIETVCAEELIGKVSPLLLNANVEALHIKGKVINEKGEPIPYASIYIKGTKTGVISSQNGEFSICPLANWQKVTLVSSSVGFESQEVLVERNNYSGQDVIMQPVEMKYQLMGEIIVTRCYKKSSTETIPVIPVTGQGEKTKSFRVFPNPVSSGANLTIEWIETDEGYYNFQLLNQSGQQAHQQQLWIDAKARLLSIDVPLVAAGSYFLILTNKKTGKKFSEKIIIQ